MGNCLNTTPPSPPTPELPTLRAVFLEEPYLPTSEPPEPPKPQAQPPDKCGCGASGAQKVAIQKNMSIVVNMYIYYCKKCGNTWNADGDKD
jgi:hypothetical protein